MGSLMEPLEICIAHYGRWKFKLYYSIDYNIECICVMIHYPSTFYTPSYKQHMDIYGVQQIIWVGGFTVVTPHPESDLCCFANWKSPRNEEERYTSSKLWGSLKSHQRKWMLGFEDLLRSKEKQSMGLEYHILNQKKSKMVTFPIRYIGFQKIPAREFQEFLFQMILLDQSSDSFTWVFLWICRMPNLSKPTHLPVEWPCGIWFAGGFLGNPRGPFTYQYKGWDSGMHGML